MSAELSAAFVALTDRIAAALALHAPVHTPYGTSCAECVDNYAPGHYPCPTAIALGIEPTRETDRP